MRRIFIRVAAMLFSQSWVMTKNDLVVGKSAEEEALLETEDPEFNPASDDPSRRFPSLTQLRQVLREGSLLNVDYAGRQIGIEGSVVTFGCDVATKKGQGQRLKSVNADNWHVEHDDGSSQDLTTGFWSLPGKDQKSIEAAVGAGFDLLAVLGRQSVAEVKLTMDFLMADREAAQAAVNRGLVAERVALQSGTGGLPALDLNNCNGHVLLCIDKNIIAGLVAAEALHPVFETTDFLKSTNGSSLFIGALYGMTKCFSSSHATLTYTQGSDFRIFLSDLTEEEQAALHKVLLPSSTDRFARLGVNCFLFLRGHGAMVKYLGFVGASLNKLTIACESYLRTPWMQVAACAVVYFVYLVEMPFSAHQGVGGD
jgi:hypothetical protein